MATEIIVSLITSGLTLAGVVVTVLGANAKTNKVLTTQNELTLYRINQLEKKQDKHNEVIERTYKIEEHLGVIDEQIKVANHRIEDLEKIS